MLEAAYKGAKKFSGESVTAHQEDSSAENEKGTPVHSAQVTENSNGIPTIDIPLIKNALVNSAEPESSKEALGLPPVSTPYEKSLSESNDEGK